MASAVPDIVTALSVELGNISLATWIEAPVACKLLHFNYFFKMNLFVSITSRISLIFIPPFPIKEPHWVAGTISLVVIGGFGTLFGNFCIS